MAVISFKQNTLQYRIVSGGYTDSNGDYHKGEVTWSDEIKCDVVPNTGEAKVLNADGTATEYSFVVYLPENVRDFAFGEIVRINRYGNIYELTVKGFHRYQTQAKLWV